MSIELALDLNEEQAEKALEFLYKAETTLESSTAFAVLSRITRETLATGESRTSHKAHGAYTGKCRRSIDTALKALRRANLIERVGTSDQGTAIYKAKFEGA